MFGAAFLLQATLTIGVAGPATSAEYLPMRLALSAAGAASQTASEQVAARLVTIRSPAEAAEALAAGRVDLVATTLDAALRLGHGHGVPPRLVFGLTAAPPVALLVPAGRRAEIRSVADLAGKTVGLPAPGTPEAEALVGILSAAKLSAERVTTVSLGERQVARALAAGEVAAAVLADPLASRLVQDGQAAVLADLRPEGGAERWLGARGVHAAVFVAGDSRLGERELVPVARALLRAMAQARTTPPGELAAGVGAAAAGEEGDFALRVAGVRGVLIPDGLVTESMLEAGIDLAQVRARLPVVVKLPGNLERLLFLGPLRRAIAGPPR